MTKEERHNAILEQLIKTDAILVSDLSDRLAVSSVTIRKDLTELEKAGKLYRSHGKAIAINPFTGNRTVNEKEKLYPEEKYNIGMEAAKFIEPNDSIILASGTTIHAFAHCINPAHKLTVVSASLQASIALSQEPLFWPTHRSLADADLPKSATWKTWMSSSPMRTSSPWIGSALKNWASNW